MSQKPEDKKPDGVINPQAAATETPKVVDNSAQADNNIKSVKTDGKSDDIDRNDPNIADRQPGDPSVKVKRADGTVEERDATDAEAKAVKASDEKPEQGNPPATDKTENKNVEEVAIEEESEKDDPIDTVKLDNGQKEVDVPAAIVVKRNLFSKGFKLIDGESYPDDIKDAYEEFQNRTEAAATYTNVDNTDPLQSNFSADKKRRGASTRKKNDEPILPVREVAEVPENLVSDGVDRGANGQIIDPATGNPKENTRLAQALNK